MSVTIFRQYFVFGVVSEKMFYPDDPPPKPVPITAEMDVAWVSTPKIVKWRLSARRCRR